MTGTDILAGAGGETPAVLTGINGWHIALIVVVSMAVAYGFVWLDDWDHHRRHHGGNWYEPCTDECGRKVRP